MNLNQQSYETLKQYCKKQKKKQYVKSSRAYLFFNSQYLKKAFMGWSRIVYKKINIFNMIRAMWLKKQISSKLKILYGFRLNIKTRRNKRLKEIQSLIHYDTKLIRTTFGQWADTVGKARAKEQKNVISILHWSGYNKWKTFNLLKTQVEYEARLRYLKVHAYVVYKYRLFRKFCSRIVLENFREYCSSRCQGKIEINKAFKYYARTSKKKVIERFKKLVNNIIHWTQIKYKIGPSSLETTEKTIYELFSQRILGIKRKRLDLAKYESFAFWNFYAKNRINNKLLQNQKLENFLSNSNIKYKKNIFDRIKLYSKINLEKAAADLKAKEFYFKHLKRVFFLRIANWRSFNLTKKEAKVKATEFNMIQVMQRYLSALINYSHVKKQKKIEILKAENLRKASLQRYFLKISLKTYVDHQLKMKLNPRKKVQIMMFWRCFTREKIKTKLQKNKLNNIAYQKYSFFKKNTFFQNWIEFQKKMFMKKLFRNKISDFYNLKLKRKYLKLFEIGFIATKNQKLSNLRSIYYYKLHLKRLIFDSFKTYYARRWYKNNLTRKSINFWCRKGISSVFKVLFNYYKLKTLKKLSYKEAKDLRMVHLQKDIIKKWFKVGIYLNQKQEIENSNQNSSKSEKIWKLVQKVANIWLSKIRRRSKPKEKPNTLVPIQITPQITQDFKIPLKSRPPPRRLTDEKYLK